MAYAKDGIIENVDINDTLLNPTNAAKKLNAIWGVGKGNIGYGQLESLPTVDKGKIVGAKEWNDIISRTDVIARHQDKSITSNIITPGDPVNFNEGLIKTNIEAVSDTRGWCKAQGTGSVYTATNLYQWRNRLEYRFTCVFNNLNEVRYFWNCGGQFAISTYHPSTPGKPITTLISDLATAMGTIYWTCTPESGKKTKIAGFDFDAVTKIGGSGTPNILTKDTDYYSPAVYNTAAFLFQQKVAATIPAYSNSTLTLVSTTAGAKGPNEDNGYCIFWTLIFDAVPDGALMPSGGTATLTVIPPAPPTNPNSWLTRQSWSLPSVSVTSSAI
jgi:hypothetical protein